MTRALAYERYGGIDTLSVHDLPLVAAGRREVRVRVHAAALNPKDVVIRQGKFAWLSGRRFPKRVGVDFAGEVVQAGRASGLEMGEPVYGVLEEIRYGRGTVAEEVVCMRKECARMPRGLSFEQAAALPLVSLTALQALRDLASVGPGDRVAIHGASGGVGTVAIQIAKALGAHVTTTSGAATLELCRSLGADETLDYTRGELLQRRFDLVFDVYGNLSFSKMRPALEGGGVYISTLPAPRVAFDVLRTLGRSKRAKLVLIRARREDLETVTAMVERGELRPVVDRVEPLERAQEAFAHLESRHAHGKVVIRIDR